MDTDELRTLIDAALDNRLSSEQRDRLETLILTDAAARRLYVELAYQQAALSSALASSSAGVSPSAPVPLPLPSRGAGGRVRRVLTWAAIAAGILLTAWFVSRREPTSMARLVEAKGCRWEASTLPTEAGAALNRGRLRLAEGLARIELQSGAEITLEGPADLEIVSPMLCILHAGQVIAHVPPQAVGFVLDTANSKVTDFGTRFGVSVRDGATADVRVFEGRVDVLHRPSGQTESMHAGGSLRFAEREISTVDLDAPGVGPAVPAGKGPHVVQISTAVGRGRDAFVIPLKNPPPAALSDSLLLIKHTRTLEAKWNRKAYLGFDLSSIAGQRVLAAELRLTFAPTGKGFAAQVPDSIFVVYGLTDEKLDSWDEHTIQWENAPANADGGAALDETRVVRLGSFRMPQGEQSGTRTIQGPELTEFLRRDTNRLATLILVRETPGYGGSDLVHGVASRRHPTLAPPTLRLTVADDRKP
jgi:ferric-dicitrate binding protein FerR (iron transport regulator)